MYEENDEEYDQDRDFENKYDAMFGSKNSVLEESDHDEITGRKSKRPKMSLLNKGKVSKQEMDDLFLRY